MWGFELIVRAAGWPFGQAPSGSLKRVSWLSDSQLPVVKVKILRAKEVKATMKSLLYGIELKNVYKNKVAIFVYYKKKSFFNGGDISEEMKRYNREQRGK